MSGVGGLRLLLNREFVDDLTRGIEAARRRVLIQVMTFDGDASGLGIAERLIDAARRGVEVRLLVDCFALRYVSDQRATRPSVRTEAAQTRAMFERLRTAGITVTFTQPFGPMLLFGLSRNHKKIYVIDDHAYLGGINISDHNFGWRDFMICIDDPSVVEELVEDFRSTERGERRSMKGQILTNTEIEPVFKQIVQEATRDVVLASPYGLDLGTVELLETAIAPSKTVVALGHNNFALLRATDPYLRNRLRRSGVKLRRYPGFFHARFVLVDDSVLLVGSSNFTRHSLRCNQEIGMLIGDQQLIAAFKKTMVTSTRPLDDTSGSAARVLGAVVAHLYFHGIISAARLVAQFAPPLARRLNQ